MCSNVGNARQRHSVTFHPAVAVQEIPGLSGMTEGELSDLWFTRCDLKRMRDQDYMILRNHGKLDREMGDTRGLEYRGPIKQMEKRVAAMESIASVLLEQNHQKSTGKVNHEEIRSRYIRTTKKTTTQAIRQGAKDAEEARAAWIPCSSSEDDHCTQTNDCSEDQSSQHPLPSLKRTRLIMTQTRRAIVNLLLKRSPSIRREAPTVPARSIPDVALAKRR